MRYLFFILSLFAFTIALRAQQPYLDQLECKVKLENAKAAYLEGHFPECIVTLEQILDSCKLTKEDKEQALEILAKSYIEIGDLDMAEALVNLLLKNFPHYELKEDQNPELFNRLVKKYQIHPLFSLGIKNTGNWLRHKTTKVYSILDGLDYSKPLVESGKWFTYYGVAEYEFTDGLSINGNFMFFSTNYTRNFSKDPGFKLSYWEKDLYIEFPFYLKKYFNISKNVLGYVSGGAGVFFTLKASGNASIKYTKDDVITGLNTDFEGEINDINVLGMKNKTLGQWNAGAGIGYELKNLKLYLDVRYLSLMGSINAPEKIEKFPVLRNDYFYIDQSMKINQFEVGATITYTLLNSVKRIRK